MKKIFPKFQRTCWMPTLTFREPGVISPRLFSHLRAQSGGLEGKTWLLQEDCPLLSPRVSPAVEFLPGPCKALGSFDPGIICPVWQYCCFLTWRKDATIAPKDICSLSVFSLCQGSQQNLETLNVWENRIWEEQDLHLLLETEGYQEFVSLLWQNTKTKTSFFSPSEQRNLKPQAL